jgi:acetyltransferase-like isoleucine patch superfamily enzyme
VPAHEPEVRLGDGGEVDPGVLLGYRSGRDVDATLVLGPGHRLRSGTVIYEGSSIGARFQTGHHVVVREQSRIGDDVSVWSNSVIDYGVEIGDGVKVHSNCYVAQWSVLGPGSFLAPGVSFANDLYPGDDDSAKVMRGPVVGAGAQLGVNVTVLPYVSIGEGTIVGAGSVVTRDLPAGVIAYGNPARPEGAVTDRVPILSRVPTSRDGAADG